MSEKLRIVHVATRHRHGGAERNLLHSIDVALEHGHDVYVVVGADARREWFPSGVTVLTHPELVRAPAPRRDIIETWHLRAGFRALRPDVVWTHQSKAGILGRLAAPEGAIVVHSIHMPSFGPEYGVAASRVFCALERFCGARTDYFVAVGKELVARYQQSGVGAPNRYRVVRSPIDIERLAAACGERSPAARTNLLRRHGLSGSRPTVLAVTALDARKRVDLMIRRLAPSLREELQLLVLGAGPEEGTLHELVSALDLDDSVKLAGFVDDVVPYFQLADIMVHASVIEGVPQSIVQAHAAGVPVVATECIGVREIPGHTVMARRDGADLEPLVLSTLRRPPVTTPWEALSPWCRDNVRDAHVALLHDLARTRALASPSRAALRGRGLSHHEGRDARKTA